MKECKTAGWYVGCTRTANRSHDEAIYIFSRQKHARSSSCLDIIHDDIDDPAC